MQELIESFLFFLSAEKNLAKNTILSYRFDLEDFAKFLIGTKKDFASTTYFDIISYFEFLAKSKEIESSSQLRKTSVIFNFYEFLIKEKGFIANPIKEFERPYKNEILPIFLEKNDMEKLLSTAKSDISKNGIRNYAIIELLYSSGMRVSECLTLKTKEVLDRAGKVCNSFIICGKGAKERVVFLNDDAKEALKSYLEVRSFFAINQHDLGFLFETDSKEGHLTRQNFFYSLKKIGRKAGLEEDFISPHKIRHSFATHLFLNGIDIRILQEMLGHSDIGTTQIYTHINQDSLKKVVEQFHPFGFDK
jgi:integrase/recombinase XerD